MLPFFEIVCVSVFKSRLCICACTSVFLSPSVSVFCPSLCSLLIRQGVRVWVSLCLCANCFGYICIRLCVSINLLSVFVFVSVSTCFCVCLWVDRGVCPRLFVCVWGGGRQVAGPRSRYLTHTALSLFLALYPSLSIYLSLSLSLLSCAHCSVQSKPYNL